MEILLTGGTGFIGSHCAINLLEEGYNVILVDNLSNSNQEVVNTIQDLTKKDLKFYNIDICDSQKLSNIFEENQIKAVIHLAAYKAVKESIEHPLKYYRNNLLGLITLLEVMNKNNVNNLIFSSSACVYGYPDNLPLTEDSTINPINPYGNTKRMCEQIIEDFWKTGKINAVILRYFNPVGAHPSGLIGENPKGIPNNLFPYIYDVLLSKRETLYIFGSDYPTVDGTGVRDYIHVMDLASGHRAALTYLLNKDTPTKTIDKPIYQVFNLGSGKGYSVLEVVHSFETLLNKKVNYCLTARRDGDAAEVYTDTTKAKTVLGWSTEKTMNDMVKDSWNYINCNK